MFSKSPRNRPHTNTTLHDLRTTSWTDGRTNDERLIMSGEWNGWLVGLHCTEPFYLRALGIFNGDWSMKRSCGARRKAWKASRNSCKCNKMWSDSNKTQWSKISKLLNLIECDCDCILSPKAWDEGHSNSLASVPSFTKSCSSDCFLSLWMSVRCFHQISIIIYIIFFYQNSAPFLLSKGAVNCNHYEFLLHMRLCLASKCEVYNVILLSENLQCHFEVYKYGS